MTFIARECPDCKYVTLIMNDDYSKRSCNKCGGNLEIIMEEKDGI